VVFFNKNKPFLQQFFCSSFLFGFIFTTIIPYSYAQDLIVIPSRPTHSLNLPPAGTMVNPSPSFVPVMLKGMTLYPDDPLRFDFIIDSGNSGFADVQIKQESNRLVKYFLAAMTAPQIDLWVNLSPYEANKIIPDELGKTELGRDMLAQDYILKQLAASLVHPDRKSGKEFWARLSREGGDRSGGERTANAFNKVWIIPEEAVVCETGNSVYIVKTRLKVMSDADYEAMRHNSVRKGNNTAGILRAVIIPEIEREVNEGSNFALLRQIYQSLILAQWYKETIKNNLLSETYIEKNKIKGVDLSDPTVKDRIYQQYVDAFKKGVFELTRQEQDRFSGDIAIRRYFSGGEKFSQIPLQKTADIDSIDPSVVGTRYRLSLRIKPYGKDGGQTKEEGEHAKIEQLINGFVKNGYDEQDVRLIIDEHWKRLVQREPVDMREKKWLERMDLSVKWWMESRPKYDYQLVNVFGDTPEKKKANVARCAEEFKRIMEGGENRFFVYSGGSGVGKSTIWNALKNMPGGGKFKKFLMYTSRERRPDEDPIFNKDLDLNKIDPSLARVIAIILDEKIPGWSNSAVTIDTVADFKENLLREISREGIVLSASASSAIDKILDFSELGEKGRRVGRSPRHEQANDQDVRINLGERIGRRDDGSVRVYGEFDGVQYYFATDVNLRNGGEGEVVSEDGKNGEIALLEYGNLLQALSFKAIENVLNSQSDEIYVLETTPENVAKIQKRFPAVKSFFVSPFKTVAVVGASGFVGKKIYSVLRRDNRNIVIGTGFSSPGFAKLDLIRAQDIRDFVAKLKPDVIIYAAGVASPQQAKDKPEDAEYLNKGVVDIFRGCFQGHFIYLSSDYVFDGENPPYDVASTPNPINFYGETKLAGERSAEQFAKHSIIRCGLLFGYNDRADRMTFVKEIVDKIEAGEPVAVDNAQKRYPVSIDDLASAVKEIITEERYGIQHINGEDGFTKKELAEKIRQIYNEEIVKDADSGQRDDLAITSKASSGSINVPSDSQMKNTLPVSKTDESLRQTIRAVSQRLDGGKVSLKGGSTNTLRIVRTDNGEKAVRKESPPGSWERDKKKFKAQVRWLLGLPAGLQNAFPRIIRHNLDSEDVGARPYYDMSFYEGRTVTQSIIYDGRDADFISERLRKVLTFWRDGLLKAREASVPDDYLQTTLIDRTRESISQVKRDASDVFGDIIDAEYLTINGKRYKNLPQLLDKLENDRALLERLTPPKLRLTHGDFHFDNMFFTKDGDFKLLDPRGDLAGDPVYDLAKIAHTVIGKYDFLNYDLHETRLEYDPEGQISISIRFLEDSPDLKVSYAWRVYQELERRFPRLTEEFFGSSEFAKNDPYWRERLSLSLAKIMANLPIYHLKHDGKEDRAVALYAMGVVFLNDFVDKMALKDGGDHQPSVVGGIDMGGINVKRRETGSGVRFDPAIMREISNTGVDGFVPVFIDLTLLHSVLSVQDLEPASN